MAVLLFPIQLYADFSGYSDMAIGVGKLLGFDIQRNFNHPLLARNIAEYWRKWHISLTTWITDYVFMPLSIKFRDCGMMGVEMAVMINLVVIGLWHGANWTYAAFGLYHGVLFVPLVFMGSFGKNRKLKSNRVGLPYASDFAKMVFTYILVAIGLIIFKSNSLYECFDYMSACVSLKQGVCFSDHWILLCIALFTPLYCLQEWFMRLKEHPLQIMNEFGLVRRWSIYVLFFLAIYVFQGDKQEFIYFQF